MVKIENLSFITEDNKQILKNVSYTFEKGKIYSVLGNNGAGKSTLAKLIMGFSGYHQNHTGKIHIHDEDITLLKINERAKKGITYTHQEPVRFKGISVSTYLKICSPDSNCTVEDMINVLETVGLSEKYLDRKVDDSLSGGERKRVELASTLLMNPEIIFFDEPDSGIDLMSNKMLKDIFIAMKKRGTTVVSITHREEISLIADRAILICDGKLIAEGKPEEVNGIYKKNCDACHHINTPDKTWRVS